MTNWHKAARASVLALVICFTLLFAFKDALPNDVRALIPGSHITDADDPRFDPETFKLEPYLRYPIGDPHLPNALRRMFPPGTSKEYVDRILVQQAGMIERNPLPDWTTDPPEVKARFARKKSYSRTFDGGLTSMSVIVDYDEGWKTKSLFYGSGQLY